MVSFCTWEISLLDAISRDKLTKGINTYKQTLYNTYMTNLRISNNIWMIISLHNAVEVNATLVT